MAKLYTLPSLPCALPRSPIPENVDLDSVANQVVQLLGNLREEDFLKDAIWRDSFALTGTLRTFYSASSVLEAWTETSKTHNPDHFVITGVPRVLRPPNSAWIDVMFTFETSGQPSTLCSGFISVVPTEDGVWKIWILRTILEQLKSQPSVDLLEPVSDVEPDSSSNGTAGANGTNGDAHTNDDNSPHDVNGSSKTNGNNGVNGAKTATEENLKNTLSSTSKRKHFDCVVVGGGQAGLGTGGRLKALGVSYVILEKHMRVGDSWGTRYDSTKC
jgi:hypothetical protein